jgi:ArsR family transcriptional regulator, virulence genes transcriptional regulator
MKNETQVLELSNPEADKKIKLDYSVLKKAVLTLRAINHPLRKEIMSLLEEKKKMTVTELYVKLRIEQSVASQHLAILRRADVLKTERDGKFIYYSINTARVDEIADLIKQLAQ